MSVMDRIGVVARLPLLLVVIAGPVQAANLAPLLSGTPRMMIPAGTAYGFRPFALDINHDPLAFNIVNKPPWASFNITTGELSGTPLNSQSGMYSGIVISVSDGFSTAVLPAFFILVTATGAADLRWSPPTTNTDGTPLTDLAGYRVYYRRIGAAEPPPINVQGAAATSYHIGGLITGFYSFGVTALSAAGVESQPTPARFKYIP
jgi:hypothetical protein